MAKIELKAYRKLLPNFIYYNFLYRYTSTKAMIKSSECNCPWGAYKRRHAAALFISEIHNLSRTDVECSWKERNAPDISRKSIAEIFPPTKPGYTALLQQPNQGD